MAELGHERVHVLKMDCEGCEWDVLAEADTWLPLVDRMEFERIMSGRLADKEFTRNLPGTSKEPRSYLFTSKLPRPHQEITKRLPRYFVLSEN